MEPPGSLAVATIVTLAGTVNTLLFVGERIAHTGGWLKMFVAPGVIPLANQFVGSLP